MKISNKKSEINTVRANRYQDMPNFRAKIVLPKVNSDKALQALWAASSAMGLAGIFISHNNNQEDENISNLRKFLAERKITWGEDSSKFAYNAQDIESIVESYKKSPELVAKLVNMNTVISFAEEPRFKAPKIKDLVELEKENPILLNKLVDSRVFGENVGEEYTYAPEDIKKIMVLGKENPELIERLVDSRKTLDDGRIVSIFKEPFEFSFVNNAYKNNPLVVDELLENEDLLARQIEEISSTFSPAEFYYDLKAILPENTFKKTGLLITYNDFTKVAKLDTKHMTVQQMEWLYKTFKEKFTPEVVDVYRKYIENLDLKLEQIERATGKIKASVTVDSDDKLAFAKNFLANNNPKIENVYKNFDFAQYGKEGIPLKYIRKDFINNIDKLMENIQPEEKNIILNHFGLMPGLDGYEGLLNNKPFENQTVSRDAQNVAQKVLKEINIFTKENEVITGNKEADEVLTALIRGIPQFAFAVGKDQHSIQQYSVDIHILKALQYAMNNPMYSELSDLSKTILKTSIVLHDIGKKGKVQDPGHIEVSTNYANVILEDYKLPKYIKNRIVDIISKHHWFTPYGHDKISPKVVAAFCRHDEDIKNYEIFAKSDIKAVNDTLYKSLAGNMDFDDYFTSKMAPVYDELEKIRSKSPFVFDTKFMHNGDKFPRKTIIIDDEPVELKVLNLNELDENESLEKYGFAPNVLRDNATFLVHATSVNELEDTMKLVNNPTNQVAWSCSLVDYLSNVTIDDRKPCFIFNADQADISIAYKDNLSLGVKRNFDNFVKILTLDEDDPINYERYKDARVYLRRHLMDELSQKDYNLSEKEYAKLADFIINKRYTTQFAKNIKISDKLIKAEDIKEALETSRDYLFVGDYQCEVEVVKSIIAGLFLQANKLEDCDKRVLKFAAKHDLGIVLADPKFSIKKGF